jgi:Protein of unknown function (DUF726)
MNVDEEELQSVGSASEASVREHELPPLEERKRFLACLSCILLSSYKYDAINSSVSTSISEIVAASASHDISVEADNSTGSGSSEEDEEEDGGRVNVENDNFNDNEVSMFLEDEEVNTSTKASTASSTAITPTNPSSNTTNTSSHNTNNKPKPRWRRPFAGRNRNNACGTEDNQNQESVHSAASASGMDKQRRRKQRRMTKAQQKLQLAAIRHYRRRYVVADIFLQSSCELLLLDKHVSEQVYKELEPKLRALQAPRTTTTTTTTSTNANGTRKQPNNSSGNQPTGTSNSGSDGSQGSQSDGEKSDEEEPIAIPNPTPITPTSTTTEEKTPEQTEKEAREKQIQQQYLKQYEWMTEYDPELALHLSSLSPGSGYRCLCWLLFQHLLNATRKGYDARVRYAFKSLAVAVLVQDIERTLAYTGDNYMEWKVKNYTTWVSFATRKFEQMETAMATRLLKLARSTSNNNSNIPGNDPDIAIDDDDAALALEDLEAEAGDVQVVTVKKNQKKLQGAKKNLVRGLKIGGVGVVAGTLLAVTGGMAAPAIAGALTFLGMGAVAGTFLTLASTTAVVHLFGVAGGSLAAYKMSRRTAGLTEFKIVQSASTERRQQEDNSESTQPDLLPEEQQQQQQQQQQHANVKHPRLARWRQKAKAFKDRHANPQNKDDDVNNLPAKADLSRTVCISGWLTDKNDFQRPWGISPTDPPASKLEKLQRFYRVYNPDLIPVCDNLLKRWKREESTFWELLEDKYGCNPDTLFPLKFGPMYDAALTEMEIHVLDKIIVEIGEARGKQKAAKHAHLPDHIQSTIARDQVESSNYEPGTDHFDDSLSLASFPGDDKSVATEGTEAKDDEPTNHMHFQRQCYASVFEQVAPSSSLEKLIPPDHLVTVWDFSSRYGGEVYSLHWESNMLMKLCQCFRDVALQATASAGQQALRLMVANTIALAASVPIYIMQAMNSIDETWNVVMSRAEEAGKELARSLLINNAGHRPVTLLGYSFGARVVFSCLKQLLVYQQQWEEYHEQKNSRAIGFAQQEEGGKKANRKEKKWMLAELEFDREPASVVEDVVIMGAPMYLSLSSWRAIRQIVAGRLVNVYSRTDKILGVMFRYKSMIESFKPVCGNCTVAVNGVENIDISDLVSSHPDYALRVGDILKRVRHGQPIRSSSNALDEIALIEEATTIVRQRAKEEDAKLQEESQKSTREKR